jgi:hypothetical protein
VFEDNFGRRVEYSIAFSNKKAEKEPEDTPENPQPEPDDDEPEGEPDDGISPDEEPETVPGDGDETEPENPVAFLYNLKVTILDIYLNQI